MATPSWQKTFHSNVKWWADQTNNLMIPQQSIYERIFLEIVGAFGIWLSTRQANRRGGGSIHATLRPDNCSVTPCWCHIHTDAQVDESPVQIGTICLMTESVPSAEASCTHVSASYICEMKFGGVFTLYKTLITSLQNELGHRRLLLFTKALQKEQRSEGQIYNYCRV